MSTPLLAMSLPVLSLLLLCIAAAITDWVAVASTRPRLEQVAKPLVPILLAGWVLAVPASASGLDARPWVLAALLLGLVGDVLLLPRLDRFVPGLLAFLVGHLAYVPPLAQRADGQALALSAALLVVPAALVGGRIVRAAKASHGPQLGAAVVVYIAAVALTAALAAATREPTVLAGGLLFALSDGLLGWNRFVAPIPHGRTLVHVTYHLAQLGLATLIVT